MKIFRSILLSLALIATASVQLLWGQTKDKILFNEGVENYRKGQYQTAQQNFEAVAQQNPQNTRALYNAGNASFLNGDFEKAKTYFGNYVQAASAPSDKARGFYNMGNVHLQEAMAAEGNPQTSGQAQSQYKNAINAYKQSLKYNPSDADAKYNLTYAMNKLQQNQKNENKDQQENKENQENKDQQQNQDNKQDQENKNNQNNQGKQDEKKDDQKGNQNKPDDQKGENKDKEQNGSDGDKKDPKQQEKDAQAAKAQAIKDLDAINNDEKKILQKVSGSKASKSTESTLEKDW
jgi:Ca-activated chloride channel family protein